MTTHEPLIAGLSPARLDLLSRLVREKGHRPPQPQTRVIASAISRTLRADTSPLSFAQERLWFIDQLEPGSPAYNIPGGVQLTGKLHAAALAQSLAELVRRHEILRTSFVDVAGQPAQQTVSSSTLDVPLVDLQGLSPAEQQQQTERLVREVARRPFDLRQAPLLRVRLVQLAERQHQLLFTMHHIISDGWSMSVLVKEVGVLYAAYQRGELSSLPELRIQYADFAVWQREWLRGEVLAEELSYWKQQLADAPEVLELPTDRPRPRVESFRGGRQTLSLSATLSRSLTELSQRQGTTLFMTLLAAFQTLLYRYTGQTDILVGTPVANRNRVEIEPLIGFFVNTLVLRTRVKPEQSFNQFLGQVKDVVLGAQAHQELPFERLVQELAPERSLSHAPLFQVMMVLDNTPARKLELPQLQLQSIGEHSATAKFDLTLVLSNRDGELQGALEYNRDLFDASRMARLAEHFSSLLEAVVADPEQSLARLPLLSAAERNRLLVEWNDKKADFGGPRCIDQMFEAQVGRTPDVIALVYEDQQITYDELSRLANQLAHYLRRLGVGPEVTVGLLVERGVLAMIGMWGVLKAGGAYVLLDAAMPASRVATVLADAGPAVLLTQSYLLTELSGLNAPVVLLDTDWDRISCESPENPVDQGAEENVAYIIFTSGSTGRPKGVAVEHRQLQNYVHSVSDKLELPFPANYALVSTLAADLGHTMLFPSLCGGGTLHLIARDLATDPEGLADYFQAHEIDCLKIVPSHLSTLMQSTRPERLLPRRRLVLGGEASAPEWIASIRKLAPECRIFNHYGPTETTVGVLTNDLGTDDPITSATVPLGTPLTNTQVYVLDSNLEPVPVGVKGEIYIGGAGVARGYLHQPELTAERFVPDAFGAQPGASLYRTGDVGRYLPGGEIEFLGRVDDQVKIRGYRIEPGEVETVLAQHPAVRQCKVLVQDVAPDGKRLVAYLVFDEQQSPSTIELRAYLKERLPEYMIPAAYVTLAQMPLTANGKVNRRLLPEPERGEREVEPEGAPETLIEEIVAGIWSEVLKLDQVSVTENFFDLGGHSLLAVQVASRVRTAVGFELPLRWVFEAPTVASLAERIQQARQSEAGVSLPPITRVLREGALPLSFAQERLWFIHQLEPNTPTYNIPGGLQLRGRLRVAALEQSLAEIVRRQEMLRTSFVDVAGQPSQQIGEELKLELPLVDLQGLSAREQQQQAERLAREEARRPFDLRQAPLLRVWLLRSNEQQHQFLFTLHHIISDGWSTNVAVRELVSLYRALHAGQPSPLSELPVQYADYAAWQREWLQESMIEQVAYWRQQLAGAPEVLNLPADRPRPLLATYSGGQQFFSIPASLKQAIGRVSRQHNSTLFMTLLAVFQTLLYRYTGESDILVGTPVANRNRVEIEPLLGFFVNTLVLRTRLAPEQTFNQLLSHVREVVLQAHTHQELPFERLVQELAPQRSLSHAPLFQVMLVVDNTPARKLELPQLELQVVGEHSATAKFDLTLVLSTKVDGELSGVVEYNRDLFDASRMARLAQHFSSLLQAVVADPEQSLARLPLLSAAERHRLLIEWNDTATDLADACLHELVAQQVGITPDAIALEFDGALITYAELNARANQLAHYLRRFGVGPDVLVGLCLEPSLEMVIGALGILKAGGAYVPLDPAYPAERLSFMLADSQAPVIVTREQFAARFDENQTRLVCLDRDQSMIRQEEPDDLDSGVCADNLAYVIYTSGSTGRPKGAVIQHRSAAELLAWSREVFSDEELQGVLAATSICFDLSVFELFVPLSRGGRVVLVADALRLPSLISKEGISLINTVPSVIAELLRARGLPNSVQTVNLAGEPLSSALVRELHQQTHVKRVFDLYGPTEDTTYSTYARRLPSGPVTIGRPLANTQTYALDHNLEPVPSGVPGELCISGRGLARGYLRRPELTAERFIPNPFSANGERLYRTGDLTRHLADGRLEYLGRSDHQVKVRGYRIELGEIEAVLRAYPAVTEAIVVVRDGDSGKQLVAYAVSSEEPLTNRELRAYLGEKLPQYMVPQVFVWLEQLPRLPNGKVSRKALPEPERSEREVEQEGAPETLIEEIVAGIWSEVLKLDQVSVTDNFFELGGHSLLAVQVASRVRTALEFELPLRWVFEAPTVSELAERIQQAQQSEAGVSLPPITRVLREGRLPLSFAQERLWFIHQLEPNTPTYNIPGGLQLRGRLRVAALEQSLAEMVRRQEMLRTSFVDVAGQPSQQIGEELKLELPLVDLQGLSASEQQQQAERLAREEARRPFDLQQAPLLRVWLLRSNEQQHQFLFTLHHIISDGWSTNVAVRELVSLYRALYAGQPSPLSELPVQYADYAAWQREWLEDSLLGQVDYWQQQLAGAPEVLDLPTDRPRPLLASYSGGQQLFSIPGTVTQGITRLSRQHNSTLFMTLLAVFQTLLYRYTGESDILVGTPVANRNRVEIEPLLGFFVNTLVLRTRVQSDQTFNQLLGQVREVVLQAHTHQEFPFERLVQELAPQRSLSHAPLFQVMLVVDNTPPRKLELPQLDLQAMGEHSATAKFDLTLVLKTNGDGELQGVVEYNRDLFDASRMARVAAHFSSLLQAVVADPEQSLARLPLLSVAERHRLLVEWNDTKSPEQVERCVHELFTKQSELTPDAIALEFDGALLSYAELNARANQLAHYLRRFGVGPDVIVGLCLERSLELVIGVLGILKAGGAYVPLDPDYPQERLSFMLADSQAPVIVTREQFAARFEDTQRICLDRDWSVIQQEHTDDLDSGVCGDNLAYVIYTSGSTGRPKGVPIPHDAIRNHMQWMQTAHPLGPKDRVLQKTSFGFDASVWEFYAPLLVGGQLMMAAPGEHRDPSAIIARIQNQGVTILQMVPSVLEEMVRDFAFAGCRSLRRLFCGGEALEAGLVRRVLDALPAVGVVNLYGPTEACIDTVTERATGQEANQVPIGRPITNVQALVLDENLTLVPLGVPAELYVGGVALARGYVRRPELTAERFIPNPFSTNGERLYRTGDLTRHLADGRLEYLGRSDHQVKVRGYRIELGEIEAILRAHPAVTEAIVIVRDADGGKQLIAYAVSSEERPTSRELRAYLGEKLPQYMVPQVFVWLEQLPRLPNGKVNRKALPEPERSEREVEPEGAPETLIEEIVAGIWSEVLKLDQVRVTENFFELGGHSLLAVQVASRVRTALEFELPLRWVFEAPTVSELAERIQQARQSEAGVSLPPITRLLRDGPLPLSFAQERLWFIDQLEPGTATYNVPGGVQLTGSLQVAALEQSLAEMVRRHEVLRTRFVEFDGRPAQEITAASSRLELPLVDLQGLSASEQQQQAERLAREEARRPFDLSQAPLLRVRLLRCNEQQHQFLFTMHHIASDGWSMNVAVRELVGLYRALHAGQPSSLPELPVQYADFAVWQRQNPAEVPEQLDYWKQQLADAPPLELPTDRRRGIEKKRGGHYSIHIPAALSSDLMGLCRRESVTLYMTLLSAYQIVLSRYSGQTDISVGTPIAGRDRLEIEGLIGFFVNTLVMRTRLNPSAPIRELLHHVRETALQAHMHRDLQFERLVEELQPERHLDRSPLFQVMLMVQPAREAVNWPGLEPRAMSVDSGTTKFDLVLLLAHDQKQISGRLQYNADLFDHTTIVRLAQAFEAALTAMVADVEQPLWSLPLMTESQRSQLLTEWNDTHADFGGPRCVDQMLEAQVSRTPDSIALVYEDQQITYAELSKRANQLAHYLRRLGVGPEVTVGLLVERGALAMIGVWGILKAGGGYVPLDVAMPASRVATVLADARPAVLLTQKHLVTEVNDLHSRVVLLDSDWDAIANESDRAPVQTATPENIAYVIYTSGSTGRPKGVAIQHRSLVNLAAALKRSVYTTFAAPLRVGLNATLTFDASVKQWLQLLDGHTLDIVPDEVRWDARELLLYARAHALEVVDCTPPQLKALLEVELLQQPGISLKAVLLGGDALDESTWEQLAGNRKVSFYNLYGPTECTVDTTTRRVQSSRPTIGRPLPNVQTYLLDQYAEPVPFGVPGEICIGGAGVARGYLHRPELTAERFVPDAFGAQPGAALYRSGDLGRYLPSGEIEFMGRLDDQVKIRGYRIEPGEIETVLAQHAAVRQCKVVVQDVAPDGKRLVAYVVLGEQQSPSTTELRAFLKERLPEYMVPAAYVTLKQMPLTASGKVNRKALPKPEQSRDESEKPFVLPRTPTEQQLATMWNELLGVEKVSIHDNFFDLGGHSLLLTQLASRMRHTMSVDVPLRSLFEAPTIVEMGQMLSQWQVEQHDPAELAQLINELKTLTPEEIQTQLMSEV